MSVRRCKPCEDNYPDRLEFRNCPLCATATEWKAVGETTVNETDALRLAGLSERQREFERWCREHGRNDSPPPSDVIFEDGQMSEARMEVAYQLLGHLESADAIFGESGERPSPGGYVATLHVFA